MIDCSYNFGQYCCFMPAVKQCKIVILQKFNQLTPFIIIYMDQEKLNLIPKDFLPSGNKLIDNHNLQKQEFSEHVNSQLQIINSENIVINTAQNMTFSHQLLPQASMKSQEQQQKPITTSTIEEKLNTQMAEEEKLPSEQIFLRSNTFFSNSGGFVLCYRPYIIQYITIIYHFEHILDFNQFKSVKFLFHQLLPQKVLIGRRLHPICTRLLDFHQIIFQDYKTIPNVIETILTNIKILEQEYNEARRTISKRILDSCVNLMKKCRRREKNKIVEGIDPKVYQKRNILSNQRQLTILYKGLQDERRWVQQQQKRIEQQKRERRIRKQQQRINRMRMKKEQDERRRNQQKRRKQQHNTLLHNQDPNSKHNLHLNYNIRISLTAIYSLKYDIINNQQYINSLIQNVYLMYQLPHDAPIRDKSGHQYIQTIKNRHYQSLKQYNYQLQKMLQSRNNHVDSLYIQNANKYLRQEYHKIWYTRIISKLSLPKNQQFSTYLHQQMVDNMQNPNILISDAQNLHLLISMLLNLNKQQREIDEFKQYVKEYIYQKMRPNDLRWYIFVSRDRHDNMNSCKIWPIIYFEHLVTISSEWINKRENYCGMNSVRIFSELRRMEIERRGREEIKVEGQMGMEGFME